jgi:hypothetical protein
MNHLVDGLCVCDAKWLPIIAAYVNKLGIVESVNQMCPDEGCEVSPGHKAAAMILNTLCGRGPLYHLKLRVQPKPLVIEKALQETGCFVLVTNVLDKGPSAVSGRELLAAYKDQHYIERNFGFLKDPMIVNSLFLKPPSGIEALGLILVLSLLVWGLLERTMRRSLKERGVTVRG